MMNIGDSAISTTRLSRIRIARRYRTSQRRQANFLGIFTPTLEPAPDPLWNSLASSYPATGEPGTALRDYTILHYDRTGSLRGILSYYPAGIRKKSGCVWTELVTPGTFCVIVDPQHRRHGVGTSLLLEAIARWDIELDKQVYTPAGARLAAHVDVIVRSKPTAPIECGGNPTLEGIQMNKSVKQWIDLDREGYKKTLRRNGMTFIVFELVQNGWDTDATQIDVTLTPPDENGKSMLRCVDNSSTGYANLSHAHTLFAESGKKSDPTKRGRFNAGEKQVLCMMDEAMIASTSGTIRFLADGSREETEEKTASGSVFKGTLSLTREEYDDIVRNVNQLFPPATTKTTFNGVEIRHRKPVGVFADILPTDIAGGSGVLRRDERKTEIKLYEVKEGEKPSLYEMGLPVVETAISRWHVDVQQKIPLNTERNNVSPKYMHRIYVAVYNQMHESVVTEDEGASEWVTNALDDRNNRITKEAATSFVKTCFGDAAVLEDPKCKPSNTEATSKGHKVVPTGALSTGARGNLRRLGVIRKSSEVCPTDIEYLKPRITIAPAEYTNNMSRFAKLIQDVSPLLIGHKAIVSIIDDDRNEFRGCSRWHNKKGEIPKGFKGLYMFEINLAYHDVDNWHENYDLLIHELAHHRLGSEDHLSHTFYKSVEHISAGLMRFSMKSPKLFKGTGEKASVTQIRAMFEDALTEDTGDNLKNEMAA